MRNSLVGCLGMVVGLAGCADRGTPMQPAESGGVPVLRSDRADEVAGDWVFRFERLVGNAVTGANGTIRGQSAIGAPWTVARGEARLSARGELRVSVEGLVLTRNGLNPIPTFRAILSCLTNGGGNTLATVNVTTALFPATPEGDVEMREQLSGIPDPCYAPIVLVTNSGGRWAAISGF